MRKLVRTLLMAGADFIKICTTGGITSLTDSWDEPQFAPTRSAPQLRKLRAKRKGVAVHAEGLAGIRNALTAEIHSLEHGWFMDEQCVDQMIKHGTWWVPTIALVPLSVERRKTDPAWSSQQLAKEDDKDAAIYAGDAEADSALERGGASAASRSPWAPTSRIVCSWARILSKWNSW